jgi:UDP-glucose 4-epimerase
MRVFLTGAAGKIGSAIRQALAEAGHDVHSCDIASGCDVTRPTDISSEMMGCDTVVHAAAYPEEGSVSSATLMETNVIGTWNVLEAARTLGLKRVVYLSSVNALGIFLGQRDPDYLPIDDAHPVYAVHPYPLSKRIGEIMCDAYHQLTGTPTICLRFPRVYEPHQYAETEQRWEADPRTEWRPYWEYGAFIDVRDAATATIAALECPNLGFATLLVAARDAAVSCPSRDLAERLLPHVPWRGGNDYLDDPFLSLVRTSNAEKVLLWKPVHSWRRH